MFDFFESVNLKSDRKISLDGVRTIWVKTSSQEIVFLKGNEDLEVKEYLNNRTDPAWVEQRGDALCLELDLASMQMVIGHIKPERIEVYVPGDFIGQIYAESASGDISLDEQWNLENIQLQTASGKILCGNLSAQHFIIKSKSGDICVKEANGDRQFSTLSGNLKVGGGVGDTVASTVSGNLHIAKLNGTALLKTVSGGLDADYSNMAGQNRLNSVSGNICIRIPSGSRFALEANTKSGMIHISPETYRFVNKQNHHVTAYMGCDNMQNFETSLSVTAVSGNISVYD